MITPVVVTAPTVTHEEIALELAQARVATLIEKPLAYDSKAAQTILRRSRATAVDADADAGAPAVSKRRAAGHGDRPPPPATPRYGDRDANCVCAGQVRCRCAVERAQHTLRSSKSSHQHQLDSITPASPGQAHAS